MQAQLRNLSHMQQVKGPNKIVPSSRLEKEIERPHLSMTQKELKRMKYKPIMHTPHSKSIKSSRDRRRPYHTLEEFHNLSLHSKTKETHGQELLMVEEDKALRSVMQSVLIIDRKMQLLKDTIMIEINLRLHSETASRQWGHSIQSKSRSSSSYWLRMSKPTISLLVTWTNIPSNNSARKSLSTLTDSTALIYCMQKTFQLTKPRTQNHCKYSFRVSFSLFE